MAAYLCLLGAREYMGRAPLGQGVDALALALLLGAALFFTLPDPCGGGMGHKFGVARHNRLFQPASGDASRQPHGSPHPSWRP